MRQRDHIEYQKGHQLSWHQGKILPSLTESKIAKTIHLAKITSLPLDQRTSLSSPHGALVVCKEIHDWSGMLFSSPVDEEAERGDLDVIIWFPEGKPSFQTFTPSLGCWKMRGSTAAWGWGTACHCHTVCWTEEMGSTGNCSQIRWPILLILQLNWNNLHFIFSFGLTFKRKICQLPKWDLKRSCLKEKQKWSTKSLPNFFIPSLQKKLVFTLELGWWHTAHRSLFWPPLNNIFMSIKCWRVTAWKCCELLSLLSNWTCHIYQGREFKEASLQFKSLLSSCCILSWSLGSLCYPSSLLIYFPCGSAIGEPREIWVSTRIIHAGTGKVPVH